MSVIAKTRKSPRTRHIILALTAAAMMCGYRSYSAIAEWGRNYGQALATALGFKNGKTPCAVTLHNIFRHLDKQP